VDCIRRSLLQDQNRRSQGADDNAGESLDFSDLVRAVIRRLIREPLLHFALLGGAIFAAYAAFAPVKPESSRIFITESQIVSIEAQFHNTWQRSPTREELTALIENCVREEVLYREGIALGLDRDDPVIRGRVKQKVEVLSEDMFNKEPTEADLKEYFASHRELFEEPPVFTFEQVYFDPARHGAGLSTEIFAALAGLRAGKQADAFGDSTMLAPRMENAPPHDVAVVFGDEFTSGIRNLKVGQWEGPVRSSFGLHLVRVTQQHPARTPLFAEVRDQLAREWNRTRSVEVKNAFYRNLRKRYSVEIERGESRLESAQVVTK